MGTASALTRRQLRQRIAALGPRGITSRVPDDIRAEIVAYVAERRRAGVRWRAVADEVGFSASALAGWLRQETPVLVPVRVRAESAGAEQSPGIVIVLPNGVRVEGLRAAEVPALLAQLP